MSLNEFRTIVVSQFLSSFGPVPEETILACWLDDESGPPCPLACADLIAEAAGEQR